VANAWATSVSSRSIKYLPAMMVAAVMEFSGAVGVGARVADTIRTKIVDTNQFADSPAVLMLGMVCAVIASSLYLTFATRVGLPVSTTHSLMGGVIGFGIAAVGVDGVQWVSPDKTINSGVVQVSALSHRGHRMLHMCHPLSMLVQLLWHSLSTHSPPFCRSS
jgi:solute carrier family 20 (sodium-dependent phosphate transporter)